MSYNPLVAVGWNGNSPSEPQFTPNTGSPPQIKMSHIPQEMPEPPPVYHWSPACEISARDNTVGVSEALATTVSSAPSTALENDSTPTPGSSQNSEGVGEDEQRLRAKIRGEIDRSRRYAAERREHESRENTLSPSLNSNK